MALSSRSSLLTFLTRTPAHGKCVVTDHNVQDSAICLSRRTIIHQKHIVSQPPNVCDRSSVAVVLGYLQADAEFVKQVLTTITAGLLETS